jgi:lipid-A-disaccharide synthase
MVNLLAGRELVPELLQGDCTPEKLSGIVGALLTDRDLAASQRSGFAAVMGSLRAPEGSPADAAARAVLDVLG